MTSKKIIERLRIGYFTIETKTEDKLFTALKAIEDAGISWVSDSEKATSKFYAYKDETGFLFCGNPRAGLTKSMTLSNLLCKGENITEWFFSEINKGDDLENLVAENEKEKMLVSAFPTQGYEYDGHGTVLQYQDEGMTLLDYFAAKAMNKLFSFDDIQHNCTDFVAKSSYQMAKAMLVEREKVLKELQDEPHTD